MGCHTYEVTEFRNGKWGTARIHVSEVEENPHPCLCTFPHNNEVVDKKITPAEIASLAMLGALTVLAWQGELTGKGYYYIPHSLPRWIEDEICRALQLEAREV